MCKADGEGRAGHACDHCRTCQTGVCCRDDRVDVKRGARRGTAKPVVPERAGTLT